MTPSTPPPYAVLGAGGHAKVVIGTIRAAGGVVSGVYDEDPSRAPVLGTPVVGTPDAIPVDSCRVVVAIGDNEVRRRVVAQLPGVQWGTVIHPNATVHESVTVGDGTVIFAGAVIQPEAAIGRHVIINTAATVDHDCTIGDFAHLGPGAHLAGGVAIGEGAFLGTGVATHHGVRVGAWATVGVGGVVVRNIPDGVVAVGVPARPRTG